jgi:hypothetical protein
VPLRDACVCQPEILRDGALCCWGLSSPALPQPKVFFLEAPCHATAAAINLEKALPPGCYATATCNGSIQKTWITGFQGKPAESLRDSHSFVFLGDSTRKPVVISYRDEEGNHGTPFSFLIDPEAPGSMRPLELNALSIRTT